MKNKAPYWAVFTRTDSGKNHIVKGNFGTDKEAAEWWAENHVNDTDPEDGVTLKYPNGLFVRSINKI